MTHDTWGGVNISALALMAWELCLDNLEEKDQSVTEMINESVAEVFVEQPRLHRVC